MKDSRKSWKPKNSTLDGYYSIYVAGIPSSATPQQLKNYFSRFGFIDRVDTFPMVGPGTSKKKKETTPNRPQIRGYCFVRTKNKQTFTAIINEKTHFFVDRYLTCRQILSGQNLAQQNQDLNKRRVIIKQATHDLPEKDLKNMLELLAGKLDIFYVYRSNKESHRNRKHYTCSAMFSNPQSVENILRLGSIPGPEGRPIFIKKFYHYSKNPNIEGVLTTGHQDRSSYSAESESRDEEDFREYHGSSKNISSMFRKQKEISRIKKKPLTLQEPAFASSKVKNYEGSSRFHSARPTSSNYHKFRQLHKESPSFDKNNKPWATEKNSKLFAKYLFRSCKDRIKACTNPGQNLMISFEGKKLDIIKDSFSPESPLKESYNFHKERDPGSENPVSSHPDSSFEKNTRQDPPNCFENC